MDKKQAGERLQVVLARHGIASRRGVVSLIEAGKVKVNGKCVRQKGFRVNLDDKISVDDRTLEVSSVPEKKYYLFNKPKGVITTLKDPHAHQTIADFFKDLSYRLHPVGRLVGPCAFRGTMNGGNGQLFL